jgi:hypothetical protein
MNAENSPDSRMAPAPEAVPAMHTPMMQGCVFL